MFVVAPTARFSVIDVGWTPCKVLVSSGDEVLLDSGVWVPASAIRDDGLVYAPAKARKRQDDYSEVIGRVLAVNFCPAARTSEVISGDVRIERGLLRSGDLARIHSLARDCAVKRWGTVRRRSVGELTSWQAPTSTVLRLSKRWPSDLLPAPGDLMMKQADYLVYSKGDSCGWHDHKGESLTFLVALLNDGFEGGAFQVRVEGDEVRTLNLGAGDVVFCASHVDHRVLPVVSGTRISLNLDFWDAETARHDRRSIHDK